LADDLTQIVARSVRRQRIAVGVFALFSGIVTIVPHDVRSMWNVPELPTALTAIPDQRFPIIFLSRDWIYGLVSNVGAIDTRPLRSRLIPRLTGPAGARTGNELAPPAAENFTPPEDGIFVPGNGPGAAPELADASPSGTIGSAPFGNPGGGGLPPLFGGSPIIPAAGPPPVVVPPVVVPPVVIPPVISAVPEPSVWMLLILGFGMIGFATRKRNASQKQAAISVS
jgi:PEP-CTERM motif